MSARARHVVAAHRLKIAPARPIRRGLNAGRGFEFRAHAARNVRPITLSLLSDELDRRIPRAVVAIDQPAPVGVEAEHRDGRFRYGGGDVSDAGADGDD